MSIFFIMDFESSVSGFLQYNELVFICMMLATVLSS